MATRFDLICEQGADLSFAVSYRRGDTDIPVDTTGGLARMQARASMNSATPFLDIDSAEKGGIVIEGADGRFLVFIPAAVTAVFAPTREAVYDLEFVDAAGRTSRVLEGRFRVAPQVTR
jgi:hypothetical protein